MKYSLLFTLSLFMLGCGPSPQGGLQVFNLKTLNGESFATSAFQSGSPTVLFFLSPECPLCLDYANSMREFEKSFKEQGVAFYAVVPTEWFSDEKIDNYKTRFGLSFPFLLDPDLSFTNFMQATTTPQVLVLNGKAKTVYSGAIDNWAFAVGKKRAAPTEHYLRDALDQLLQGERITLKETPPVGCYIE